MHVVNNAYSLSKKCLQKPIIFNGLPSEFNPFFKKDGPPKRFKCEAIPQEVSF